MASRGEINDSDGAREAGHKADQDEDEESSSRGRKTLASGRTRKQRFKAWFRDMRLDLYFLFFVGSFLLFVMGTLSVFAPTLLGAGLAAWFRSIAGYNTYLFLLGLLTVAAAGYLLGGLVVKRQEFHRLTKTKAKSDFVRNLDKIERLAFDLGTKESKIVADKKREFKIRH